jgi:predicted DNA-binding transcriptional regulator YafY
MPKTSYQKKRILFLRDMFLERTDENHPITMEEIIRLLSANGMETTPHTVSDDIALLQNMGLDIIAQKMPIMKYYVVSRDFESYEVRLLMDCIQSSKALSASKTEQLMKKLSVLCSKHEASQIKPTIFDNYIKSANDKTQYNIATITQAIIEKKQITFRYFVYLPSKERLYQETPQSSWDSVKVTPCFLVYNDDNYNLIALESRYMVSRKFSFYKIDRMEDVNLSYSQVRYTDKLLARINISDYKKQNFSLCGGNIERVTIQFPNHLADTVIDRFGIDVDIKQTDEASFQVTERIAINPEFFGWIFGLGAGVKIVSPQLVAQQMKDLIKETYQTYTIPRNRRKDKDSSLNDDESSSNM